MKHNPHNKAIYFAILLIAAGTLILLNQMGKLGNASHILISWPMLIIAVGLINLIQRQSRIFGVILLIVGVFFLLPKIYPGIDPHVVWKYWPVLLIIFGLLVIFKFVIKKPHTSLHAEAGADMLNEVNVFGGNEKPILSQNFKGGNITCVFGGSELDFRQSRLSQGKNQIDIFFMFGGCGFKVPDDWKVETNVTAIFGGFSDKRKAANIEINDPSKVLEITGLVIFGGGEIKN